MPPSRDSRGNGKSKSVSKAKRPSLTDHEARLAAVELELRRGKERFKRIDEQFIAVHRAIDHLPVAFQSMLDAQTTKINNHLSLIVGSQAADLKVVANRVRTLEEINDKRDGIDGMRH